MIYLFLGEDLKSKDTRIAAIRAKAFDDTQALNFDLENIDAQGLTPDTLKKSLVSLPVINPKRLVIVRNIHKLKAADTQTLLSYVKKPAAHLDLVLESSESSLKGDLKEITSFCSTTVLGVPTEGNVFDMTKLMSAGRTKDALMMLNSFYSAGTHPLQIMGGLVWYWGKDGRILPKDKFEAGLKALEAADLNIKRSRLEPEYAVEKLVVELVELLRSR